MDYGAKLAKELPNPNRRSKHYAKQSKFTGSNRQLRGQILKRLLRVGQQSIDVLGLALEVEKPRLMLALEALRLEGFLELDDTSVSLK